MANRREVQLILNNITSDTDLQSKTGTPQIELTDTDSGTQNRAHRQG